MKTITLEELKSILNRLRMEKKDARNMTDETDRFFIYGYNQSSNELNQKISEIEKEYLEGGEK